MFFSDKITLRTVTSTIDGEGFPVNVNADTEVWADVVSVTRAEFYAANANKIDMTQAFDIHVEDWNNQTYVVYNSKLYKVIRAYQKGLGIVELNCSDKMVD